ncbi:MAG: hypothetical protein RL760_437 [Candidatus Eisenbacteria bacterium]
MRPEPREHRETLDAARALTAAGRPAEAFALAAAWFARPEHTAAPQPGATALAEVAQAAGANGDDDLAMRALDMALAWVDWADLRYTRGVLHARRGSFEEARADLDRALAINPRYRAAALERAMLDARLGRVADAMTALRAFTGQDHEAEMLRAGLERLRSHAVEDAESWLRETLGGGDRELEGWLAEARTCAADGAPERALVVLRRAVAARPGYPDLHALLGAHELRAGQLDDGIASLSDALCLNPDFHDARYELALGLEARGEREAALAEVNVLLAAMPAHAGAAALRDRLGSRRRVPAGGPR